MLIAYANLRSCVNNRIKVTDIILLLFLFDPSCINSDLIRVEVQDGEDVLLFPLPDQHVQAAVARLRDHVEEDSALPDAVGVDVRHHPEV